MRCGATRRGVHVDVVVRRLCDHYQLVEDIIICYERFSNLSLSLRETPRRVRRVREVYCARFYAALRYASALWGIITRDGALRIRETRRISAYPTRRWLA